MFKYIYFSIAIIARTRNEFEPIKELSITKDVGKRYSSDQPLIEVVCHTWLASNISKNHFDPYDLLPLPQPIWFKFLELFTHDSTSVHYFLLSEFSRRWDKMSYVLSVRWLPAFPESHKNLTFFVSRMTVLCSQLQQNDLNFSTSIFSQTSMVIRKFARKKLMDTTVYKFLIPFRRAALPIHFFAIFCAGFANIFKLLRKASQKEKTEPQTHLLSSSNFLSGKRIGCLLL